MKLYSLLKDDNDWDKAFLCSSDLALNLKSLFLNLPSNGITIMARRWWRIPFNPSTWQRQVDYNYNFVRTESQLFFFSVCLSLLRSPNVYFFKITFGVFGLFKNYNCDILFYLLFVFVPCVPACHGMYILAESVLSFYPYGL